MPYVYILVARKWSMRFSWAKKERAYLKKSKTKLYMTLNL